jgi:microcystin-dependent protein
MSYQRAQRRAINRNTLLDNRLTTFINPHNHVGDLHVERDETIDRNLTIGNNLTAENYYASGNYYLDNFVLIPAGTVIQSAAISEPGGWFDCDGRELIVDDYPQLYAAIGTTYGGGEGVFSLPDMRGRVVVGQNGSSWSLGNIGGEQTHTLSVNEIPGHTHNLTRRSNPDAGAYDNSPETDAHKAESSAITNDRAVIGSFATESTGGGLAHNNMQPYLVLRYLIKY